MRLILHTVPHRLSQIMTLAPRDMDRKMYHSPQYCKALQVALITPSYPSMHCGISTYSRYLISEMVSMARISVICRSALSPKQYIRQIRTAVATCDVVHVQHAFALYGYMGYLSFSVYSMLRKQGKPLVTTIHEMPNDKHRSIKARVANPYLWRCIRTIVRSSDAVIVHSQNDVDLLEQYKLADNIKLIPHGSVRTNFVAACSRVQRDRPAVGVFGFITERKGIHRIIDSLSQLSNIQLIIAGTPRTAHDEVYLARLHEQVASLGLSERVKFVGFVPDEQMPDFFRSVDVVVFPYSQCTASGALHLALAHGCVVLTSNLPVFDELKVRYDCLEEFELERPETLSTRLEMLLQDEQRRIELIRGCRRMMDATSWAVTAQRTYNLYLNLVSKSTRE
jgi:glycosyltransferase involved in cell wall biosynthesis